MAQLSIKNRFSQIMSFVLSGTVAAGTRHLTIGEHQAFTLPREVTRIRVLWGSAWVSHMGKDIVLYRGQTMELESSKDIAVITSTGRRPVELELTR